MSFMKIFKHKHSLAWLITTVALVAVVGTVNILASGPLYMLPANLWGNKRAITSAGENAGLYVEDAASKGDAYANGNAVTQEICEEGMVLLKNENHALPLKANAKVSVFGKNSVSLVYGGSGSAAPKMDEPKKSIFDSLTAAGFEYNPILKFFYEDNSLSGKGRPANPAMENSGISTFSTGETPISSYTTDITNSYASYGDAALVVFSRIAGENWDLPRVADDNADRHYLELDNNERALLKHICDSNAFEHVVVLINSSNNIDLGFLELPDDPAYNSKIDAAMLIGSPGGYGIMALGKLLSGEVNPSGHTVDTLYTNYKADPTWQNFGNNLRENGDAYFIGTTPTAYFFVDYEENIYMGYRYYETRGHIDGETWYNKNVVYPFGHGLSYTSFSREISNLGALGGALDASKTFTVDIKVKNTGSVPGKDVVQLYASAPYTNGGIEKPYKVLVGFAKTKLLQPNEDEVLHITVDPYDFASFDDEDRNANGFKGYELEKGDYTFFAGIDAHTSFADFTKALASDVKIDKDPVTKTTVEPLFPDANDHLQQNLSRADFAGTFPVIPGDAERLVDSAFIAKEDDHTTDNPNEYDMPTTDAPVTVSFKSLIKKPYNDQLWEDFLDQMSFDEMLKLFNEGSYSTPALERLGVPQTISCDGPTGIVAFMGTEEVYGTCYYCSECLVAQTYNVELAEKQGSAVGDECLFGDQRANGSHLPYSGWYAPGLNLHRSPFGGRNTEYYSEDPFISGKMAAHVIQKAQEKGVYTNIKHFALNDQETHRSINGCNTWCNEQAIREVYLRAFEIAVKEGKTKGLMSSFNRIGQKWTGGSYKLLTNILREEWGFEGSVICDFHNDSYMNNREMIYAGGDVNMTTTKPWKQADIDNPGDVAVLRRAAHNTLYSLVNSNAVRLDILGYKLPVWQEIMFIGDGVIALALAVWGFFAIRSAIKKPEGD